MKNFLISVILFSALSFSLNAQVTVTGAHTSSNGTYLKLSRAFNAINKQTQTGNKINIQITGNYTDDSTTMLNAGAWDSLIIYPTTTATITTASGGVLLNGSKVTIDGRVDRTGSTQSLTISNSASSNTTLNIRGSDNTIKHCILKSKVTNNSYGTLLISNCNNTIVENNIFTGTSSAATDRPINSIYSVGVSSSYLNSGTVIRNNNFSDFMRLSDNNTTNCGISFGDYNIDFTITGNSFYETTNYTAAGTTNYFYAIYIKSASGTVRIDSNYIGGSEANCGGTPFTKNGSASAITSDFAGINVAGGTPTTLSLNRNIIKNIKCSFSTVFKGINIGSAVSSTTTVKKNIVGDSTGTGSINLSNSSATSWGSYGIFAYNNGSGSIKLDSNIIGSFITSTTPIFSFYGIYLYANSSSEITNNLIGSSSTANNIYLSTTAEQGMYGIYSQNTSSGSLINVKISGNKVANLTNGTTGTTTSSTTSGIYAFGNAEISGNTVTKISTSSVYSNSLSNNINDRFALMGIFSQHFNYNITDSVRILNNTVYGLTDSNSSFAGAIAGILYNYYYSITPSVYKSGNISNNFIHSLNITGTNSTSAKIYGIFDYSISGYTKFIYANNIISLGGNSVTNIYGYYSNYSYIQKFCFNTIYISGSPGSGTSTSCGFLMNTPGQDTRNNIVVNARSNSGSATGKHYVINLNLAASTDRYDYNNYVYSGSGAYFGRDVYHSIDYATLAAWSAASQYNGGEKNSTNIDPQFASAGGTLPANYKTGIELRGTMFTGITTDYDGTTRKTYPTKGAYEFFPASFPVTITATSGSLSGQYTSLDEGMLAVNMGLHKGDIEVKFSESHTTSPLFAAGNDMVGAVMVTNGGTGYSSAPTITFSAPTSGTTATGTAVMFGTTLIGINITNRGSGYTTAPTITITGSGTGAAATSYLPEYTSLKIYPTVSGLQIGGNIAGPVFDFNGADNVTIDGRVNGTGSTIDLLIINTRRKQPALRLINDASYNTVKYSTLKAQNDSSNSNNGGVVIFQTGLTTGNNNNIITKSNITSSSNKNFYGIISMGLSESVRNSNNTVSDNMFYGLLDSAYSYFMLWSYNNAWTITGNRFYEPTPITKAVNLGSKSFIRIENKGGLYTLNNNYFGGANSSGTGKWTYNNHPYDFYVIRMIVDTVNASDIQGNTITNIDFPAEASNGLNFYGIYAFGALNIGTETPNIIGAATGTQAITINSTTSSTQGFTGIYTGTGGVQNIRNNIIGAIKTSTSSNGGARFTGILIGAAANAMTIKNNTIGSLTDSASINVSANPLSLDVYGIRVDKSTSANLTIDSNRVANIVNGATGTSTTLGMTIGISIFSSAVNNNTSKYSIVNNTVKNITSSNNYNNSTYPSPGGIYLGNTGSNKSHNISGNSVTNLSNTNSSFQGYLAGIFISGADTSNTVDKNIISGLSINTASTSSYITGIKGNSYNKITNNIIGISGDYPAKVYGIWLFGVRSYLYFNTVYLSGTVTAGSNPTYAVYSYDFNYCNFMNNILANQRTNNGGTGKHYGIYTSTTIINSFTINYNDYYVPGSGGYVGYFNGDKLTLANWQASFGDANSVSVNPGFTGGLTVNGYKPATSLPGVSIDGYTTDYSGTTRGTTPSMGALEGAAISISATSGESAGFYNTLKETFDAINAGTHKGSITVKINKNLVETATAVLYGSGGNSDYTGVSIYPIRSGISITGDIAGAPLIELNGADYVNMRGDSNGTGGTANMIISNTSTSGTAGTSVIRFVNNASYNNIQYCVLKGSSLAESTTEGGIISVYQSDASSGNSYNNINYNKFTNAGGNRPVKAVYSAGSEGKVNSSNTFNYNEFYDLMNLSATNNDSYGICIFGNSSNYNFWGNSFYETSSYAPTGTGDYYSILIDNGSGNGFYIMNNNIGGSAASCGGSAFTKTDAGNNDFYGIWINSGTTSESFIMSNTIKKISWSNSGAANFYGVYVFSGLVNPNQNTIGYDANTSKIILTNSTSGGSFYGIYCNYPQSTKRSLINNYIGDITTNNTPENSTNFYGIYAAGSANYLLTNNIIGATQISNSVLLSSASTSNPQLCYGIYASFTGTWNDSIYSNSICNITNNTTNTNTATTGLINGIYAENGSKTIYSNTIYTLKIANANNADGYNSAAAGIVFTSTSAGTNDIRFNTIYDISNTSSSFTGYINGIFFNGGSTAASIYSNFIYSISAGTAVFEKETKSGQNNDRDNTVTKSISTEEKKSNTSKQTSRNGSHRVALGANIRGINLSGGSSLTYNNIISLGGNSQNTLYGIADNGGINNLYQNSVYIGGSPSIGTSPSYAFYSGTSSARNIKNNIFFNARTNNGATGTHYAIGISDKTGLTINYNNYYVTGSGSALGVVNGTEAANLEDLRTATGQDANSINTSPLFTSAGSNTKESYKTNNNFPAPVITGITKDCYLYNRGVTLTNIGAWESNIWKGGSSYSDPAGWVKGAVPGSGETIIMDAAATNSCQIPNGTTVHNIINNSNTYVFENTYSMYITGDIITNGTSKITSSNGMIIFTGTSVQNLNANSFTNGTLETLQMNSTGIVVISGNLSVTDIFHISAGKLIIADNSTITYTPLSTSNRITGNFTATSMIVPTGTGKLKCKVNTNSFDYTFPIGDTIGTDEYSPIVLNFTSGAGASAFVSTKVFNTKHPNNNSENNYINRYWTLTPEGLTTFNYSAKFYYTVADVAGTESNIYAGRYDGSVWAPLNPTNYSGHYLNPTGQSTFGDFTGGEQGALPVVLSSFNSAVNDRNVKLKWTTESEESNSGFEVERKLSNENSNWEKISFVQGKGTINTQQNYAYTDLKLSKGKYNYRLKQVDYNGNYSYFDLNNVVEIGIPTKYDLSQNYPNPFNTMTKIDFALPMDSKVTIAVYDLTGREVARLLNNEFKTANYYTVNFNGSNLSSGAYFYRIVSDKFSMTKKMMLVK